MRLNKDLTKKFNKISNIIRLDKFLMMVKLKK